MELTKDDYIIGVDIGGTWIRVAACTGDLNEDNLVIETTRTLKENKFSISTSVCDLISKILKDNKISLQKVAGIGLATAGPINLQKGEVFNNANLGFKTIPLKGPISNQFPGIPIYIINDCRAAVLGIHYFEAEENEKENIAYITISTGIGGGVICNSHLLLGKEGNAAEIGHGKLNPMSEHVCNCGAKGCWEVYSSGTGIRARTLELLETGEYNSKILMEIVNGNKGNITAKEVFEAARKGDELSQKIVQNCILYMKIGIGLVNNYYDCTTIFFGGAVMKDSAQLLPPLIQQFETDPIQFTINHPPKLKLTRLGDHVGLRGALTLIKYIFEENPLLPPM